MYDPLKHYCPKCNIKCSSICLSCGYNNHNLTMYKKEKVPYDFRAYDIAVAEQYLRNHNLEQAIPIIINNTSISIPSLMASYAKYIRYREQGAV